MKEKSEKLELIDFYRELQDGRKLELQNLWQRSIMLMTFFVIFFTAYFVFIGNVISADKEIINEYRLVLNGALLFISVCGMSISILYILMGKGSKLWYEKYEASISWVIEGSLMYSNEVKLADKHAERECEYDKSKWPDYFPRHGFLREISGNTNDSIFSSKSGEYSVSKVNIAIGLFGFFFWEAIAHTHLILIFNLQSRCSERVFLLPTILFLVSIGWMFFSGYVYSGNNKKNIRRQIKKRLAFFNKMSRCIDDGVDKLCEKCFAEIVDKFFHHPADKVKNKQLATEVDRIHKSYEKKLDKMKSLGNVAQKRNKEYKLSRKIRKDYMALRRLDTLMNNYVCQMKSVFFGNLPDIFETWQTKAKSRPPKIIHVQIGVFLLMIICVHYWENIKQCIGF